MRSAEQVEAAPPDASPPADGPSATGLEWLLARAPSTLSPLIPGPAHTAATLARWHHEGLLERLVDEVYLSTAWSAAPAARCAALALLLRPGGVIAMASATWARGGPGRRAPDPAAGDALDVVDRDDHTVDLLLPPSAGRSRTRDGVRTRRLAVRADETERLLNVPVTRPLRTAVDLLMWGTARDEDALGWLWGQGVEPDDVRADLDARRPTAWTVRGTSALDRVQDGCAEVLAAVPLYDPVTTWTRARTCDRPASP